MRKGSWEQPGRKSLPESAGDDYSSTKDRHVGVRERNGHHESQNSLDNRHRGDDASLTGGLYEYRPLNAGASEYDTEYSKRRQLSKEALQREDPDALTLPYTTSASEFLYGQTVVTAALRARRRQLYKLYMVGHAPGRKPDQSYVEIEGMAHKAGIPIQKVQARLRRVLDKISEGRPHNVRLQLLKLLPDQSTIC